MHPFYGGVPNQNLTPSPFQQVSGNFNGGLPNSNQAQMQSSGGFTPNPQNQFPFNNPMHYNGFVNQPAPPNYCLSAPTMPHYPQQQFHGGFSLPGPNPVSGPSMSRPFGGVVAQNSNPGQWQVNSTMTGMNSNPGFVNGQLETQNLLQNVVNILQQNPSQLNILAQMAGCGNQFNQGVISQNMAFAGNPQVDLLHQIGTIQQQANPGQHNLPPSMPGVNQSMQMNSHPPTSGSSMPQQTQPMSLQASQGIQDETNVLNPNHMQNRPFKRGSNDNNFNSRNKFQKTHAIRNNERNQDPQNSADDLKDGKRRSLAPLYTPQEIKQWCEERKKNYPTKANVDKKLVSHGKSVEDAENEAKLRRERLKEILAKQAELGFEVPEIPSHYLSDSEPKGNGRGGRRPNNRNDRFQKKPFNKKDRFQNRFNNKRKGYNNNSNHDRNECSTESREGNQNAFGKHLPNAASRNQHSQQEGSSWKKNTRKPSLLEKLLASDVKRDNSRLLQAFRFMVMNSFFDDQSSENTSELKFPEVIVKDDSRAVESKEDISELGREVLIEGVDGLIGDTNGYNENAGAVRLDLPRVQAEKYEAEEGELTE